MRLYINKYKEKEEFTLYRFLFEVKRLTLLEKLSFKCSELGRSGSSDSDLSMLNWLVGEWEFSQIVTNHFCLHFTTVPVFASIDIDYWSYHFWDNNAVSEMSFDGLWFLSIWAFLLGFLKLLEKSIVSLMDTMSESPSLSCSEELDELVHVQLEELLKFNTSVSTLLECLLLMLVLNVGDDWFSFACHS